MPKKGDDVLGRKLDITGQCFGELRGVEPTDKRDYSGSIVWRMKCSCGNEHFISVRNLNARGTKTCGRCPSVEYEIGDNVTCGKFKDGSQFLIDTADYKRVSKHSWCRSGNGYIHSSINGEHICLHRFIINEDTSDLYVDHINRNKRDNRKENLRITCATGNGLNKYINKEGKTSKYRGVCWDKSRSKWRAEITVGKSFNLGRFNTEEDAAKAYNYAAYLLAPEYIDFNKVSEAPNHIKNHVHEKCKDHLVDKKKQKFRCKKRAVAVYSVM